MLEFIFVLGQNSFSRATRLGIWRATDPRTGGCPTKELTGAKPKNWHLIQEDLEATQELAPPPRRRRTVVGGREIHV